MPEATDRAPTPPHHPTFNVRLADHQIDTIVQRVLPNRRLTGCRQLESGKSFNNRIYFLDVSPGPDHLSQPEQYVLKIAGHFFGARKIQNEVACFLLMAQYCPQVPVPQVVAWSEDGRDIQTLNESHGRLGNDAGGNHGWLLLTRMPGEVLDLEALTPQEGNCVMEELAGYVAQWRSNLPVMHCFGNIRRFKNEDPKSALLSLDNARASKFSVGGLVLCGRFSPSPLNSAADYYASMAQDRLLELEESKVLAPLRSRIQNAVASFVTDDLRRLPFLQKHTEPASFTHLDLAPRNILISRGSPVRITGILDFEFAGFYPWAKEFTNIQVSQSEDWPSNYYGMLLQKIRELGQWTPAYESVAISDATSELALQSDFNVACTLEELLDNIAPWYIAENSHSAEELAKEVDSATSLVLQNLDILRSSLP